MPIIALAMTSLPTAGKVIANLKSGWIDDFRFYTVFNSISVISGWLEDDNERLCTMELCVWLRRYHLEQASNPWPLDQQASI